MPSQPSPSFPSRAPFLGDAQPRQKLTEAETAWRELNHARKNRMRLREDDVQQKAMSLLENLTPLLDLDEHLDMAKAAVQSLWLLAKHQPDAYDRADLRTASENIRMLIDSIRSAGAKFDEWDGIGAIADSADPIQSDSDEDMSWDGGALQAPLVIEPGHPATRHAVATSTPGGVALDGDIDTGVLGTVLSRLADPALAGLSAERIAEELEGLVHRKLHHRAVARLKLEAASPLAAAYTASLRRKISDPAAVLAPRPPELDSPWLSLIERHINNHANRVNGKCTTPRTGKNGYQVSNVQEFYRDVEWIFHPFEQATERLGQASRYIHDFLSKAALNGQQDVLVSSMMEGHAPEMREAMQQSLRKNGAIYHCTTNAFTVTVNDRVQLRDPSQKSGEAKSLLKGHVLKHFRSGDRFTLEDLLERAGTLPWTLAYVKIMFDTSGKSWVKRSVPRPEDGDMIYYELPRMAALPASKPVSRQPEAAGR